MNPWKDDKGNCKCESCGRVVPESQIKWEKGLGYCPECYAEIVRYNKKQDGKV